MRSLAWKMGLFVCSSTNLIHHRFVTVTYNSGLHGAGRKKSSISLGLPPLDSHRIIVLALSKSPKDKEKSIRCITKRKTNTSEDVAKYVV
jgi:hypothetical protein